MKKETDPEQTQEPESDFAQAFDFGGAAAFGFDTDGFEIETTNQFEETRYSAPKLVALKASQVQYEYAEQLARDIDLRNNSRYDVIVSGNFIFGDFIEAFMVRNNIKATSMTLSTLSLNQNNIDSLTNLMQGGFIDELNLVISVYFYGMNRKTLIPYIYENLDNGHFQLAVAGIHTKTMTMKTLGGRHIVMHGSANLRSSGSVEQFCIEDNKDVYDFYESYCQKIIDKYKTINKAVNHSILWSEICKKKFMTDS